MGPFGRRPQVYRDPLQRGHDDPQLVGGYHLIASRSRITFTARSIWGLLPVRGHFAEVTGTGELSADGRVSGALRIEVASLRTVV